MPEPDLIRQQRELLTGFRQATAERTDAEADAEARRQRERAAADAALNKVQQEIATQRARAIADAEARQKADRASAENALRQARRTGDDAVATTRQAWSEARDSLAQGSLGDLVNAEARPTAPQPGADPASQLSQAVAVATGARKDVRDNVAELLRLRRNAAIRRHRLTILGAATAVVVIVGVIILVRAMVQQAEQRAEATRVAVATATRAAEETQVAATRAAEETQVAATRAALLAEAIKAGLMVEVPAGDFLMGPANSDSQADNDERPQHKVTLDGFWIGRTEVTNAQYRKFMEAGGYNQEQYWTEAGWAWKQGNNVTQPGCWDNGNFNQAAQPVVCVSWYEASAYARWAGGRLPTEAEWEKAARGPDGRIYPWGNAAPDCNRLNYSGCIGHTTAAGSYADGVSPYGALDLAGNVWEWVSSKYGTYPYRDDDGREDQSGADARLLRGGSWDNDAWFVRSTYRLRLDPGFRNGNVGFRLAAPGL